MADDTVMVSVRIPRDIADRLGLEARERQSDLDGVVTEVLSQYVRRQSTPSLPSVALAEFIGCLESDPADGLDSSMVHEVFAQGVRDKHEAGRL